MIEKRASFMRRGLPPIPVKRVAPAWGRLGALRLAFWLGIACGIVAPGPAFAQSCSTPTVTALAFGDVTAAVLAGGASDSTATLNYSCSGFSAGAAVRICITLGDFVSGVRRMSGGGGTLDYQVYQDASRTVIWGNNTTPSTRQINTTANGSGAVSGSITLYGRVLSGQSTDPPASYTRTMPGNNPAQRLTAAATTTTPCSSITTFARNFSVTATATISNLCNISASTLNFGSTINLTAIVDQSSTIQALCTSPTPYNIGLNAGTGVGATVTTRKMTSGGSTINYSLYRNSLRTQVWGSTIGTDTVSATGNGSSQNYTVHGRVPVQTTPNPAIYSDTINVTVTY